MGKIKIANNHIKNIDVVGGAAGCIQVSVSGAGAGSIVDDVLITNNSLDTGKYGINITGTAASHVTNIQVYANNITNSTTSQYNWVFVDEKPLEILDSAVIIGQVGEKPSQTISAYGSANTIFPQVIMTKADTSGSTIESAAQVDDGDVLGQQVFKGFGATVYQDGAYVRATVDGTASGDTDLPTELSLWTTPDGSATPVKAVKISPSQVLDFPSTGALAGIQLLGTATLDVTSAAQTTIYTVPAGRRCILDHIKVVSGATASPTAVVTFGQNGAATDFLGAQTLTNLAAQFDTIICAPVPNATPVKTKSYAAATVIEADVTTADVDGGTDNTVYVFGTLY